MSLLITTYTSIPESIIQYERFSQRKRLLRTTALLLRLRNTLLPNSTTATAQKRSVKQLSAYEISQACQFLALDSQRVAFADDYKRLFNIQIIGAKSQLLPFSPFLDKDTQMMRARGRLSKLPLDYCSKHPIILDAKQRPVELFLQHLHRENGHCGLEHLRSVLHSEYWVLNSQNAIRKVVETCYDCRRQKAAGLQPEMSDLPTFRFPEDKPFPFQQVVLDLFGSFATKMELKTHDDAFDKRWGLLLTFLTTRAIQIGVCESLYADSFIHAFRKFIALRGQPKFVIQTMEQTSQPPRKTSELVCSLSKGTKSLPILQPNKTSAGHFRHQYTTFWRGMGTSHTFFERLLQCSYWIPMSNKHNSFDTFVRNRKFSE